MVLAALPSQTQSTPYESRFQRMAPCPSVPPVLIDRYGSGIGLASETARAKNLQGRVLWIDATANINQYNTVDKIRSLTAKIADSGFNTVVFDVKPISGQTVYPSKFDPKLLEWRGQTLPADFDPVPPMVEECHSHHLSIILSMNAFSEGHRLFKTGPGYAQPEHQTVLYIAQPTVKFGPYQFDLSLTPDQTGDKVSVVSSVPKGKGGFWSALGPNKTVVGSSKTPGFVPASGQTILYGTGKAAEFLDLHAYLGEKAIFDTTPDYVPLSKEPGGQIPLMMNLNDPAVQDHALSMIREVVEKYPADGVIYDDRLRYAGMDGDFSDISCRAFEKKVGHKLTWPDDVYKSTLSQSLTKGFKPGPYYDLWVSWRAEQIQDFVKKVRTTVKEARPTTQFGAYVGSWYGDYPALGHNYASPEAEAGFWFTTPPYRSTGTAPYLDYLMVGCYYPTATIYDAMGKGIGLGYTVESGGALCNRLVRDETWTYAGIDCGAFVDDPAGLANLVQAACASTQGVMVFDLSHGLDKLWPTFKQIFGKPMTAPHQVPGSVEQLRAHRKIVDGYHQKERPIIILNGSSGIGQ